MSEDPGIELGSLLRKEPFCLHQHPIRCLGTWPGRSIPDALAPPRAKEFPNAEP